MGSLRLSIPFDPLDSKRFNLSQNPYQISDQFPNYLPASCNHAFNAFRACTIGSLIRVKRTKASHVEAEENQVHTNVSGSEKDELTDETSSVEKNRNSSNEIKKKYNGSRVWRRKDVVGLKFSFRRERIDAENEDYFVDDGELDVNYSAIKPDLSLEHCNAVLKRLERSSEKNSLKFFDWMRRNGKTDGNIIAYNLVLRVLGRQEDWERVEATIRESCEFSGKDQTFQVFNTIIYACSKKGFAELSSKWFRMMLEYGVRPNVATFGMLMGVSQKSWNLAEAEFAFSQMRNLEIVCESAYSAMITIYTRLRLYDKAEEVIEFMRNDRVKPNLENWLVLINAYGQQGKLEQAESAMAAMQESGFSPNIVAYNTLITGYGKISKMKAAQRLFEDLRNVGLEPDETTFRSMVEGWGRAENYKEAKWFYDELKRMRYKPNSSNLYTMIHLQAKQGFKDGAIETIEDMLKIGCQYPSILGVVLQAYEKVGKMDLVPHVLNNSFRHHLRLNQTSFSILVIAYIKHGVVDEAMLLLKEKEWRDPAFEANLYHLLICSCKESGKLEAAVKIYNEMSDSDEKINLHITCTMIDIYSIMGRFSEAERLYLKLKSSRVVLDMIGFSIVVRMYMKAGELKHACSVLETMENREDIVPDIYLFRDMLRIYQKCGKQDKLTNLYFKILDCGINWDQETYNAIINCCARALPVNELSRMFNEMMQHGFTPNIITFNTMLDVYGKAKLFKNARMLFGLARKLGLVDVISYNTIIAAYGRNKRYDEMSTAVQEMQLNGFGVSLEAYNCMLDTYGKDHQMEKFRSVLRRMKETNSVSDHYTYNIMMNIYGEHKWVDEVAEVMRELRECGLGPDLCSYNTLIKAYGIAGMVEEAVGLVKEMRQKGTLPDKITYTNLITALRRNDQFLEAVKWSLWMKQVGL